MSNYFRQVPEFNYVSRLPDAKIGDYIKVKNLFKRGKLREDIFQNVSFFEKYQIKGDDRPDNVAFEVYQDSNLDWIVLLSNNIINVQTEWPMPQQLFDEFLLEKYGSYDNLYNGVHHYESIEVKTTQGGTLISEGTRVSEGYSYTYYDSFSGSLISTGDISLPVTNYEYEERIENDKRNIFILKPQYINIAIDDLKDIMTYKKGSSQYVSGTLKNADNFRLFQ